LIIGGPGCLEMRCLEDLLRGFYRRASFDARIEPPAIVKLLKVLRLVPSQANLQPWEIVVVDDDRVKERVFEAALDPLLRENGELKPAWIKRAPVLLVVCADVDRVTRRYGSRGREFALQDAFAAALMVVLKALELGYMPGIVREFDVNRLREAVNAPESLEPVAIIALGTPGGEIEIAKPSLDVEDFVHYNAWGRELWT